MEKYGIIGFPLGHSISPRIHNQAFQKLNLNAQYTKIEIHPNTFDHEILKLKKMDYKGFNITVPYKQRILKFLDKIDPVAEKINAVNTILNNKGHWTGYNTDIYGFIQPLQGYLAQIKSILVIGAGGAAYAVCFAVLDKIKPKSIAVINRTKSKAISLCNTLTTNQQIKIDCFDFVEFENQKSKYDLIINTTNVGMGTLADKRPVNIVDIYHRNTVVYDLIYNPKNTLFLEQARQLNLDTINGLPMLYGQAKESFKIWTGYEYPDGILTENFI